jgi:hypothetical protein
MDLNDFYRSREQGARDDALAKELRQYNTWAKHLRELIAQMTEQARTDPPVDCEWVIEDGEEKASWELTREYEDAYRISLMPDGRVVYVRGSYYGSAQAGLVLRTLELREVTSPAEYTERGISWLMMSDLFDNVISTQGHRFGITVPDHLGGATTQHWGREWSQFH